MCRVCRLVSGLPREFSTLAIWEGQRLNYDCNREFQAIKGITAVALSAPELIAAKSEEALKFNQAIEQCSPRFLLSGLPAEHEKAPLLGLYERQDDREKECGRYVYKGPDDMWMWWMKDGAMWIVGDENNIGTDRGPNSSPHT